MLQIFDKFRKTHDPQNFLGENEDERPAYIEDTEPEEQEEDTKPKRVRRPSKPRVQTKQEIVDYLSGRQGRVIKHQSVADAIGTVEPHATTLLKELMATGTIRRRGKRGSFKYQVLHKRVNQKRVTNTEKTDKPVDAPRKMPEVQVRQKPGQEKVLAFLARNEDRPMFQYDIARGSGTSLNTAARAVQNLEADGAIVRSLPTLEGTKYWLAGSVKTGPNRADTTACTKLVGKSTDANLHSCIESLVWEYMRECKQVDILVFLEWLKKRK